MKIKEKKLSETLKEFVGEMERRLAEKEGDGYEGWDNQDCFTPLLSCLIKDAGEVLDIPNSQKECIDIANRAMMLWYLDNKKTEGK